MRSSSWSIHASPAAGEVDKSSAWAWASMAHGSLGDLDRVAAAATSARSAALPAGQHVAMSLATNTLAVVAEVRGQLRSAVQLIDEAVRLADESPGQVGHRFPVHVTRGHILIEVDRLQDALSTLAAGRRISEALGTLWPLQWFQVFLAVQRYVVGEWDDAMTEFESALAGRLTRGDPPRAAREAGPR
jgi:ATP/maltotriose-dependent transcriptional regulator MalT